jgi:hypothetical protein
MIDLKLCYSGGSGGFLLLHLLLLTGKFYTGFDADKSINSIVNEQWNVSDHSKWKTSEIWPNNLATLSTATSLARLYFVCNPDINRKSFITAKNLVLYTDIDSQIELAYYKKANWFLDDRNSSLKIATFKKFADCRLPSVGNYKEDLVDLSILPFLSNADVVVKLQDLVNSNGSVLENLLEIPAINKQQRDLICHWKQLHPPELLQKIGINNA